MSKLFVSGAVAVLAACASTPAPEKRAENMTCEKCPREGHLLMLINNNTTARFYVRGTIDGRARAFMLDTGAARSTLEADKQVAKLAPIGHVQFGGASLTGETCDWVKVNSFRVAGLNFAQAPFARCAPESSITDSLGIDYLNKGVLRLDIARATVSFRVPQATTHNPPDAETKNEIRRTPQGHAEIAVKVGSGDPAGGSMDEQWATFDTGCGLTVIDEAYVLSHRRYFHPVTADVDGHSQTVPVPFTDAMGKPMQGHLYYVDHVEIGGLSLGPLLVNATAFSAELKKYIPTPIVMGANWMLYANWIMDFKNNRWGVQSRGEPNLGLGSIHLSADQVVRDDEKTVLLRGNAQVTGAEYSLMAPELYVDVVARIADCRSQCTFIEPSHTTRAETMKLHLGEKQWERVNRSDSN